jgi:hypothetical protein
MKHLIDRVFHAHPRDINETYCQHFLAATRFGLILIGACTGSLRVSDHSQPCGAQAARSTGD